MPMPSADLLGLRREQEKTFASLCSFLARPTLQDGQGGFSSGDYVTTRTAVPCRIVQSNGRERFIGEAQVTDAHYTLTVPYADGLLLNAGMRVRFEGHAAYEVEFTNEHQDLRTAGRALLRRIS